MEEFLELYDPHEKGFGDIKLIWICNPVDFTVTARDSISSVADNIEKEKKLSFFNRILDLTKLTNNHK